MKIWLDDIRDPPDETWTHARSAFEFQNLWKTNIDRIVEISFDHDIASFDILGNEITGYHCLCMIEKFWRYTPDYMPPVMHVHSANPVGAIRMMKVIERMHE